MSISSIARWLVIIIIFFGLNIVLSPSLAENRIIFDGNNFLEAQPLTKKVVYFRITGYSSSYDETDDTPWLTAYNTLVRDGIVASNILPFGTKLRIPSLFGEKIFIVEDRMNPRFNENLDIWFPTKWEALQFGVYDNVLVEILE